MNPELGLVGRAKEPRRFQCCNIDLKHLAAVGEIDPMPVQQLKPQDLVRLTREHGLNAEVCESTDIHRRF